ncbi:hypothetical protein HAX54_024828 [Datura stramonium]|uniref:THH1/TOM1/TOM3 domain-containing protein n=1 Tax=Datura stramonium TaxID=4076 RepID=A0ABS8S602_DATST|nr:hypothetical protein [Datura stramonium]
MGRAEMAPGPSEAGRRCGVQHLKEAINWWEDVNRFPQWQDRIFHVLAVLYGVVAAVALFAAYILAGMFRSCTRRLSNILCLICQVLHSFTNLYALLVLFWAEIYYQRFPVESKRRLKNTGGWLCHDNMLFMLSSLGCIMMCFNAFDKAADLDVLDHPILNLIYYLLPPKRGITQYHPIR